MNVFIKLRFFVAAMCITLLCLPSENVIITRAHALTDNGSISVNASIASVFNSVARQPENGVNVATTGNGNNKRGTATVVTGATTCPSPSIRTVGSTQGCLVLDTNRTGSVSIPFTFTPGQLKLGGVESGLSFATQVASAQITLSSIVTDASGTTTVTPSTLTLTPGQSRSFSVSVPTLTARQSLSYRLAYSFTLITGKDLEAGSYTGDWPFVLGSVIFTPSTP